jgi:hypothetical protein
MDMASMMGGMGGGGGMPGMGGMGGAGGMDLASMMGGMGGGGGMPGGMDFVSFPLSLQWDKLTGIEQDDGTNGRCWWYARFRRRRRWIRWRGRRG